MKTIEKNILCIIEFISMICLFTTNCKGEDNWDIVFPPHCGISRVFKGTISNNGEPEEGLFGYIDESGTAICDCSLSFATDFQEGLAVIVYNSDFSKEDTILALDWTTGYDARIIDTHGKEQYKDVYDYIERADDGSFLVAKDNGMSYSYGFLDSKGALLTPIVFSNAYSFSEGRAFVRNNETRELDIIDGSGYIIKSSVSEDGFSYDGRYYYSEGVAAIVCEGLWGYVDLNGEIVIKCQYDTAEHFKSGFAFVTIDGQGIIIDQSGTIILSSDDKRIIEGNCGNKSFLVKESDYFHVIDYKGEIIISNEFTGYTKLGDCFVLRGNDGTFLLKSNGDFFQLSDSIVRKINNIC